jgi:hypothetical protein
MIRHYKVCFNSYSIAATVGSLIFSSFAYAGECLPLQIVSNVETLFVFELDKPDEQKSIGKTMFPKKICGFNEAAKGRYVVCIDKRQVLVTHAQFKFKNSSFVPPSGPENPSRREHAGAFATTNQSEGGVSGVGVEVASGLPPAHGRKGGTQPAAGSSSVGS